MSTTTLVIVEFVAGSVLLYIALKLFKTRFTWWQPVLASLAAALCMYIPNSSREVIGFVVLLAMMRYFTDDSWGDLIYPVAAARLGLFPVLLWIKVS